MARRRDLAAVASATSARIRSDNVVERLRAARRSVLIIDEDVSIRRWLRRELTAAGYAARDIEPDENTLNDIAANAPDLIVLDFDSQKFGGAEAIAAVRRLAPTPIVTLSGKAEEDVMVKALQSGADDYVRKPLGMKELLARIDNALRRRAREEGRAAQVTSGDLEIDLLHRRIRSGGREIRVRARCYDVLRLLAEHPGKVLSHEEILRAVWGAERTDRIQYLRIAIRELRRKLESDPAHPQHILTEMGVGYRLEIRRAV